MAKQKIVSGHRPTKANAEQFDMLFPILDSVYNEIKELSKKKQDGALNEIKVKMTNRILSFFAESPQGLCEERIASPGNLHGFCTLAD